MFLQTPSVNGMRTHHVNATFATRHGRRRRPGPPPQCNFINVKIITVEDKPEEHESALSDRTRRKQRRVQDLSGSENPLIAPPASVDHLLPLKNLSNYDSQAAVEEVFQMFFNRAADLPDVFQTLREMICEKET